MRGVPVAVVAFFSFPISRLRLTDKPCALAVGQLGVAMTATPAPKARCAPAETAFGQPKVRMSRGVGGGGASLYRGVALLPL